MERLCFTSDPPPPPIPEYWENGYGLGIKKAQPVDFRVISLVVGDSHCTMCAFNSSQLRRHIKGVPTRPRGAFSHSACTALVITVFTPVTALKTCHL